jgi:LCP family protein required for cell wall assembly
MADKKEDNVRGNKKKTGVNSGVMNRSPRKELERKRQMRIKARRKATIKRAISAFIILVFLLITFGCIYAFTFISGLKTESLLGAKEPASNESVNILLLGMDIGDVDQEENFSIKRTDTMMLLNYNPKTDKIHIVSIPRDTLIEVEDAYDQYGNYEPYWKMNAAYALGGEEEVISQVESLLEVNVNYLVEIDYEAFRNIIDALGGIEMYIERDMNYDDDAQDLHIHFNAGETVHLDGKAAEEFFRWRKNNDGTGFVNGDLGRISNQQMFMKKVIEKVMNPFIIFKIPTILNVVQENISTNMSGSKLVSYGLKMLKNSGINMVTLQGYDESIYGQSFLVVDKESNKDILQALQSGTGSFSDTTIPRGDYKILVLNGTRVNGLAGDLKIDLENIGYANIEVGNAEQVDTSTILANDSDIRDLLKTDTGISKTGKNKTQEYSDYDAVIIIGEDYTEY